MLRFIKYGQTPASFTFIFGLFEQTIQFYTKSMPKIVNQYTALGFEPTTSLT